MPKPGSTVSSFSRSSLVRYAGIAHRQCGAHRDLRHDIIDTEEPRDEALAAFLLLRQTTAQSFGQLRKRARQVLRRADRFGEGQAFMPLDRRMRPIDGFLDRAQAPDPAATPAWHRTEQ